MRKFTQFVLITAAIMAAPSAFAEMKIAVLNYQMALLESDAAKQYAVDAEKKFGPQLNKLKNLERDAKALQDKLVSNGSKMSQGDREKAELDFKQKARDFQFRHGHRTWRRGRRQAAIRHHPPGDRADEPAALMMSTLSYTLGQLAAHVGAEVRGDADLPIQGLATLQEAGPAQLSFLANPQYRKYLPESRAGAVLLTAADADGFAGTALVVANPYLAYASLSHLFDRKPKAAAGIHPTAIVAADAEVDPSASVGAYAVIESGARIGAGVSIGAHCVIGARSVIGEGGWLAPRVTLYHDVTIGARVSIQSGAVIGGEGFGFANEKGVWQKIAQIGGVTIGDDVEIGANTTIDRGALSDTLIGNGVKLDNQIMIAHNVQIGDHTAMAACVGISGSAKIGRHCMLAGGVGLVGHIEICDNVFVTGMTMVTRSITEPGSYSSGTAMQPAAEWKKSAARIRQLDDMARRLQQLEKRLAAVTSSGDASSDA